ncbi:MAG: patatin-like phospholipase family protein [Bacteroidota bacterium]
MKHKLLFLLFIIVTFEVISQEKVAEIQDSEELKVGVVLSGGGAKGLAHIGALQVIEDAGVKIDYIGGTSMGAIIGGLYAAGYTPHQLDSIFRTTDFNKLIRDELPRNAKTYFERRESEKYGISLPFENFKPSLPSGLSKGQNVYNLLAQLTAHIQEDDFSKLSIPFYCIATNLETGEEVIMDTGSLALAMSVSGAIPSVFRPIEMNGKLHTDGGVVNNYPIEEMKKRGANLIIGVDVQEDLHGRERLQDGFEIMNQVSNFRTIKAMRKKRALSDIYIRPDIKDFSVLDFDLGKQLIENGKIAARDNFAALRKVADQQNLQVMRTGVKIPDSLSIQEISISGNKNYPRNYIKGKLRLNENERISFKDINNGLNNLAATDNFDRINYTLKRHENNYDINLEVFESKENKLLRFGIHYDELYKSAVLVNFTQKSLFVTNDIFSVDFVLGDNIRYNLDYYIDKGKHWSIGFRSRFNKFERNVDFAYVDETIGGELEGYNVNKIQLQNNDFTNQIYVETLIDKQLLLGLGAEQKHLTTKTETIVPLEEQEDEENLETIIEQSNLISAYGYLEYDSLDDKFYPSTGFLFKGQLNWYLASVLADINITQFSIVKGEVGYVFPIGNRVSLGLGSELGFRIGNEELASLNFFLGGYGNQNINNFRPFYGYDFFSLTGNSYIKGMIDVYYNFYKKHYFILSGNYANVDTDILSTGEWFSLPDFSGYALGYGFKTFLGPIDLKYSYSPELKDSIWYISLGYRF